VREVAAGFSHELKSPLAGLSMQAQLMLSEIEDLEKKRRSLREELPKIKEELHYIVNKAMDAARRIDAVRGVAEPAKSQIEEVYIPAVLDNSLANARTLVGEINAEVKRDLPGDLPPVRSNAKQLEIVFTNLMKNALESMDGFKRSDPHQLCLSGREQNHSVQVSVRDTGAGIAARDLGRLFDPSFTTKGRKGMGMGLYLSQQIVKAHGGSIDVKSEEGRGTEFIVRLPKFETNHGITQVA
jgi:two-component system NtrC family sensor kinase